MRNRRSGSGTRVRLAVAVLLAASSLAFGLTGCESTQPLGTGRNFLGTKSLSGFGSVPENFSLSIGPPCMRREYGDYHASRTTNNGSYGQAYGSMADTPRHSCQPSDEGGPAYVRRNPGHSSAGYSYAVAVPSVDSGSVRIEAHDPWPCDNVNQADNVITTFEVSSTGAGAGVVASATYESRLCSTAQRNSWLTLATVTSAGLYVLRVTSTASASTTISSNGNEFSLRAFAGSTFQPCSSNLDDAIGGVAYASACPSVYAIGAAVMSMTMTGATTRFPAVRLGADSAGKTLHVYLFDAAEKSRSLELLDPNLTPVPFTAEIACQDETYLSQTGLAHCGTDEVPPSAVNGSTYGPWTTSVFDICGPIPDCGTRAESGASADGYAQPWGWEHSLQRTLYNDRVIRLSVKIPDDAAARFGSKQTWFVRYTGATYGSFDRATVWATVEDAPAPAPTSSTATTGTTATTASTGTTSTTSAPE